ncbi:MAG: hypothetical protein M0P94_02060 [Candidatus Absconditabacterales bacterium]|nr:hypothetical protein [Candidatus Absconditabacterales bacterium]
MKSTIDVECVNIRVYYMFYSIIDDKMSSLIKFIKKINPLYIFYVIIILFILIIWIFFLPKKIIEKTPYIEEKTQLISGNENVTSNELEFKDNVLDIDKSTCEFSDLGGFKYIDLYSGEVRNPEAPYSAYTKRLKVSGGFQDVYVCIITNVDEDVMLTGTTYYLWVIFGNEEYGGVAQVGKLYNGNYYDYNTSTKYSQSELDGRMYGEELKKKDKSYWLDLKEGFFVADNDTQVRLIKPIIKLNSGQPYINIGGNLSNGTNGIIKKFRIFYKGGSIVEDS